MNPHSKKRVFKAPFDSAGLLFRKQNSSLAQRSKRLLDRRRSDSGLLRDSFRRQSCSLFRANLQQGVLLIGGQLIPRHRVQRIILLDQHLARLRDDFR